MPISSKELNYLASHPKETLRALERIDCKESLAYFLRAAWPHFDPSDYIHGWHIDCITDHLMAAGKGEFADKILLINVPPGHAKSSTVSIGWPAWEWARGNAHFRFMVTSFRADLALRDGQKSRMLIRSDWYQYHFGDQFNILPDEDRKTRYANDKGGYRLSVPTSGIMGEGGDFIIFDDPHNIDQVESDDVRTSLIEKITLALPTRLRSPKYGCGVVVMQRLHERDYAGHLIASDYDNVIHVCLPARYETQHPTPMKSPIWTDKRTEEGELLWAERYDEVSLTRLEERISSVSGSYGVAGQLQQRPAPKHGGLFDVDHLEVVAAAPANGRTVRGWDLAATKNKTAAWTAGVKITMGADKVIYIEDVRRFRENPEKVESNIHSVATQDGGIVSIDIPQDPGQAGKAQKAALIKKLHGFKVFFSPETGSKEDRAAPLAAQVEAGNVKLVKGQWNQAFIEEARMFPNGTYKDQIDAASRAYAYLIRKKQTIIGAAPQLVTH